MTDYIKNTFFGFPSVLPNFHNAHFKREKGTLCFAFSGDILAENIIKVLTVFDFCTHARSIYPKPVLSRFLHTWSDRPGPVVASRYRQHKLKCALKFKSLLPLYSCKEYNNIIYNISSWKWQILRYSC